MEEMYANDLIGLSVHVYMKIINQMMYKPITFVITVLCGQNTLFGWNTAVFYRFCYKRLV